MKVLVVEDEPRFAQRLMSGLSEPAGSISRASGCAAALDALRKSAFDLIVLDPGLPDRDRLNLLHEFRVSSIGGPVLILGVRDSAQDRMNDVDPGAESASPEAFRPEELLARVLSRSSESQVRQTVLEHSSIRLDLLEETLKIEGRLVELTRREVALLEIFMRNPGRTLARSDIFARVWSSRYDVATNLLDVYMSRLRAKMEKGRDRPFFKTVRGVGYQFL